ncbi:MAG: hypothetical protein AAGF28_04915 [Pseudomonadota bacterium]
MPSIEIHSRQGHHLPGEANEFFSDGSGRGSLIGSTSPESFSAHRGAPSNFQMTVQSIAGKSKRFSGFVGINCDISENMLSKACT